ncbi:hypothetical protein LTR56_004111 [Elasticomyces elasticus]|nr:hypothetical protein LTR56_004111 [Elasticomyces elasticus]KAK3661327.1 hypothetical protein LTR22_007534 [Elasticomyces elasticus]KAK4928979.1 hypothetical protein LTR49_004480 [Elasticomyces elasticus]KAK5765356.1 hypothetical protein LTS12_004369 [Elasticomyces elasticus]
MECFTTDFDLEETDDVPQLGIKNNNRVNRNLVTRDEIWNTSFSATLHRVQYGTYGGKSACLVVLDCAFRFPPRAGCRYSSATIKVTFSHAADITNYRIKSRESSDDPSVVNLAPKEVYGTVSTIEEKRTWDVKIPLMFESPIGLSAGFESHLGGERTTQRNSRTELHGNLYYDHDHDDEACGATWDLSENEVQGDGIFRQFRAAIILCHPADQPMWMSVRVKPSVKFSLNPQRLFERGDPFAYLLQRNDEPVLLDGSTGKPQASHISCSDFSSDSFPWPEVLWFPAEYQQSQLTLQANPESKESPK